MLLFGLSTAPREFTKTLAPLVQLLRTRGIRVHTYLDDWIIRADNPELCIQHTQETIQLLQSLGWTINWKKSVLEPSRILDFLGLHFNLEQAIVSPPNSFIKTLTSVLSRLSASTVISAHKVTSINGRISHCVHFIHNGHLQLYFLQLWIKTHWSQDSQLWDSQIQLDAEYLSHLRWSTSRSSASCTRTQSDLLYRCFPYRMGGQLAGTSALGTVVSSRADSTYQLVGVGSHLISPSSVGTSMAQSDSQSVLRQQHSSGTHLRTRRNSFYIPIPQDSGIVSSAGSVCDNSNPNTSSRSPKRDNRRIIMSQQSQSHWMASSSRDLTQSVLCLRDSSHGHVRHSRRQGLGGRRPLHILGRIRADLCLCIVPKTLEGIRYSHITTVILIASQHPSWPWHPLLLQLSLRPRIPLSEVELFQYIPNTRRPQFHRDLRLLDLAVRLSSRNSSDNIDSQNLLWKWQPILSETRPVLSIIPSRKHSPSGLMTK